MLVASSMTWAAPTPTRQPEPRGPSQADIQAAADRARAAAEAENARRRANREAERERARQAVRAKALEFETAIRGQRQAMPVATLLALDVGFNTPNGVAASFDPDRAESWVRRYTARRGVSNDSERVAAAYDSLASTFPSDTEMPAIMRTYRPKNNIPGAGSDPAKMKWGQFLATLDQMGERRLVNNPGRMSAIAWMAAQEQAPTEAPTDPNYYVLPGHRTNAAGATPVPLPSGSSDPGRAAAERVKREAGVAGGDLNQAITQMQKLQSDQERTDGEPPLEDPNRAANNAARAVPLPGLLIIAEKNNMAPSDAAVSNEARWTLLSHSRFKHGQSAVAFSFITFLAASWVTRVKNFYRAWRRTAAR